MKRHKNKSKTIYALLSVNTNKGEEVEAFGPFANSQNASDWVTFGRGSKLNSTFRGTGTLEQCNEFISDWEKE